MARIWAADKIDNSALLRCELLTFVSGGQAAIEGSPRDPQSIAAPSDKIVGGWRLGLSQRLIPTGGTIWVADAHREDGKRFGPVRADETVTAFLELRIRGFSGSPRAAGVHRPGLRALTFRLGDRSTAFCCKSHWQG